MLDSSMDPGLIQIFGYLGDVQERETMSQKYLTTKDKNKYEKFKEVMKDSNVTNSNLVFIVLHTTPCVMTSKSRKRLLNLCNDGYMKDDSSSKTNQAHSLLRNGKEKMFINNSNINNKFNSNYTLMIPDDNFTESFGIEKNEEKKDVKPKKNIYGLLDGYWHFQLMESVRTEKKIKRKKKQTVKSWFDAEVCSFTPKEEYRLFVIDHGMVVWYDFSYSAKRAIFNFDNYAKTISEVKESIIQRREKEWREKNCKGKNATEMNKYCNSVSVPYLSSNPLSISTFKELTSPLNTFLKKEKKRMIKEERFIYRQNVIKDLGGYGKADAPLSWDGREGERDEKHESVIYTPLDDISEFIRNHITMKGFKGRNELYKIADNEEMTTKNIKSLASLALGVKKEDESLLKDESMIDKDNNEEDDDSEDLSEVVFDDTDEVEELLQSFNPKTIYPKSSSSSYDSNNNNFISDTSSTVKSLNKVTNYKDIIPSVCVGVVTNPSNAEMISVRQPYGMVKNSTHIRALLFCQKKILEAYVIVDGNNSKKYPLTKVENASKKTIYDGYEEDKEIPLYTCKWDASEYSESNSKKGEKFHKMQLFVVVDENKDANVTVQNSSKEDSGKTDKKTQNLITNHIVISDLMENDKDSYDRKSLNNLNISIDQHNLKDELNTANLTETANHTFEFKPFQFSVDGYSTSFNFSFQRGLMYANVGYFCEIPYYIISIIIYLHLLCGIIARIYLMIYEYCVKGSRSFSDLHFKDYLKDVDENEEIFRGETEYNNYSYCERCCGRCSLYCFFCNFCNDCDCCECCCCDCCDCCNCGECCNVCEGCNKYCFDYCCMKCSCMDCVPNAFFLFYNCCCSCNENSDSYRNCLKMSKMYHLYIIDKKFNENKNVDEVSRDQAVYRNSKYSKEKELEEGDGIHTPLSSDENNSAHKEINVVYPANSCGKTFYGCLLRSFYPVVRLPFYYQLLLFLIFTVLLFVYPLIAFSTNSDETCNVPQYLNSIENVTFSFFCGNLFFSPLKSIETYGQRKGVNRGEDSMVILSITFLITIIYPLYIILVYYDKNKYGSCCYCESVNAKNNTDKCCCKYCCRCSCCKKCCNTCSSDKNGCCVYLFQFNDEFPQISDTDFDVNVICYILCIVLVLVAESVLNVLFGLNHPSFLLSPILLPGLLVAVVLYIILIISL